MFIFTLKYLQKMNYKIFQIISFILLTIGAVAYVIYNARMPVDPNRIEINENGEEEIILNELEKRHLGKWYLAYEGDTPFTVERIEWEHSRYWDFQDNGHVMYHRPDGREFSSYWQVSESDSILRIIANESQAPDTVCYKISEWRKKSFTAYRFPNFLHRYEGQHVIWVKHDSK